MVWLHQTSSEDNYLDPGIYQGKLYEISTKQVVVRHGDRAGEYADLLVWKIAVEHEGVLKNVEGVSSMSLHKRSKANKWIKAITGSEPEEKFDTDTMINKMIEFRVVTNKNGFTVVDDILKSI